MPERSVRRGEVARTLVGAGLGLGAVDDGQRAAAASLAVQAMRERTEALGGTFTIGQAAGAGTIVEVALP